MIPHRVSSFVGGAAAAAAAGAGLVLAGQGGVLVAPAWAMAGWAAAASIGVGGGAWLVSCHGRSGPRLVAAMGTTIALRLLVLCAGAALAAVADRPAGWSYLLGFTAGFAPVWAWEVAWFLREARRPA